MKTAEEGGKRLDTDGISLADAFKVDNSGQATGQASSFSKRLNAITKIKKNIKDASNKFQSFIRDDGDVPEEEKSDPD